MPALVLKAISAHAKPTPQDTTLGVVQPKPLTPKLIVKAKAGHFYRLVDESTGEVLHNQTLIRQGQNLLVIVNQVEVAELVDFFVLPSSDHTGRADDMPGYLVNLSNNPGSPLGVISAHSPLHSGSGLHNVWWQPGVPVAHTLEPQAIGISAVSALSSASVTGLGLGATTLATVAGASLGRSEAGDTPAANTHAISGKLLAGEVKNNGNGDLVIDAYDRQGRKIGNAVVNADGSFEIKLSQAYQGLVVLKAYDKS